jgi:diaminohydroxyphosphoribosylaminopyrimidine deaminase/5-amino-6-(5-phosphoribosylamino)uracil reductase
MNPTNLPQTCMTIDALWLALCTAAHDDHDPSGMVVNDGESWSVTGTVSDSDRSVVDLFLPLLGLLHPHRPMVVGHLAQSLDGRIARSDGESHWISGEADLDHTHRLRAFCDAVLVGAETVINDDCRLTVRRCDGPQPLRVLLDPSGRIPEHQKVLQDPSAPTLWIRGQSCSSSSVGPSVETVTLPCVGGHFDIQELLSTLQERGIRRLFVEGGGVTISHFLEAGVLDRLHLAVAPLLLGEGRSTLGRSLGPSLADCPRPDVSIYPMGKDWLFDCSFERIHR